MKTSHDPRHLDRIKTMQQLFAWEFNKKDLPEGESAQGILKKLPKIDQLIQDSAPTWPLEKINKVDLAILRLACFELFFKKSTPPKVVVDEAVELAKSYGSESSSSFINGALGQIIKQNNISVS